MKIYQLEVVSSAYTFTILGEESRMKEVFEQWKNGEYCATGRVFLEGWSDDARRSPLQIALDPDTILAMVLSVSGA